MLYEISLYLFYFCYFTFKHKSEIKLIRNIVLNHLIIPRITCDIKAIIRRQIYIIQNYI
jgi:uncharacterized membrane protein